MSIEIYEPDKHDRDAIYCVKVGVNDHNHKFVFLTRRQTTAPPPYIPVDGEKVHHFQLKLDRRRNHPSIHHKHTTIDGHIYTLAQSSRPQNSFIYRYV